jgi:hypothetical protein
VPVLLSWVHALADTPDTRIRDVETKAMIVARRIKVTPRYARTDKDQSR